MTAKRTAAMVLAASLLVVGAACDDDEDRAGSGDTTTTEEPSTSSSSTSTSTTAPAAGDTSTAVFPNGEDATGYDDPVAAATAYATEFAGFTDPIVGVFQQGDTRSGEVEVKAKDNGPVTTVFVRQLTSDDTWWVLGSASGNIELDSPDALAEIGSPLALSGRARAFEGTVNVEVREDGRAEALGTGFVTGSGDGQMGPFEGEITFDAPTAEAGALVLFTRSAEDNRIWEFAALRVRFAS